MKSIYTLTLLFLFTSCAGPSSPFGSNILITSNYDLSKVKNAKSNERLKIEAFPKNLLYHTNFDLKVKINNADGFDHNIRYDIVYNGKKLERWWDSESIEINKERTEAKINFKNISLLPGLKNEIVFLYYPSNSSDPIAYEFKGPECNFSNHEPIKNLSEFDVDPKLTHYINFISKKYEINPSLLASLVAQESSFNSNAVSISRAVGLTQVTPIANKDIRIEKNEWKSYPDSDKLSYLNLKYKIYRGVINKKNDWRLDKHKSLEGGALYLKQLSNFWNLEKNKKLLSTKFNRMTKTDIILASYNSGASRVKRSIKKHNTNWIWSKELNEARKYVMNIKSYCHKFKK